MSPSVQSRACILRKQGRMHLDTAMSDLGSGYMKLAGMAKKKNVLKRGTTGVLSVCSHGRTVAHMYHVQ